MGEVRSELHPDDHQKVNRRIDAEINALKKLDEHAGKRRDQLAAIGLVNLDACDANIIPAVLSGTGQPLDVGRARRLATRAQRQALRTMYRICAIGHCLASFDRCEIHHPDGTLHSTSRPDLLEQAS